MTCKNQPQLTSRAVWNKSSSCCFFCSSESESKGLNLLFWLIWTKVSTIQLWFLNQTRSRESQLTCFPLERKEKKFYLEKTIMRAQVEGGIKNNLWEATTSSKIFPSLKLRTFFCSSKVFPYTWARERRVSRYRFIVEE